MFYVGQYCKTLISLGIEYCKNVTDEGIIYLAQHCPTIQEICMTECKYISDEAIIEVANNCKNLTVRNANEYILKVVITYI